MAMKFPTPHFPDKREATWQERFIADFCAEFFCHFSFRDIFVKNETPAKIVISFFESELLAARESEREKTINEILNWFSGPGVDMPNYGWIIHQLQQLLAAKK